jgi:WD40 repeat protein
MITNKLVFCSEFEAHSKEINSICFSSNNQLLASASKDKTIKVWQSKSGKLTNIMLFESDYANSITFSRDNKLLISGKKDNTIEVLSLQTKKLICTLKGHQKAVNSVAVHPNGKLIASASDDKTVNLWSIESGKQVCTLKGHTDNVMAVSFSPNGDVLASSGDINDKTVKLWFLSENRSITLKGHSDWFGGIYTIAFSPDSKLIASGSKDKTIKIWQVNTGKEAITLEGHSDDITSIIISADNKIIASGSKDKTLKLWALTTGKLISTINHHEKIQAVAFSPNSQILATGCSGGNIKLFKPQLKLANYLSELLN